MQLFNKFVELLVSRKLRLSFSAKIVGLTRSGTEVDVLQVGTTGQMIERGVRMNAQPTPAAVTVSGLLTTANILTGIITVNQGAGAASAQQLPTCANMDLAFPDAVANDSFDFSVINISTVAAEDATITTNTGWTLVGNIDIASNAAATDKSAGRFRARKTAAATWTLYRLS